MLALNARVEGRDSRYKGEVPFRVPSRERPDLSSERAPHMEKTVTVKQQQISSYEFLRGIDAKTDRPSD
jgi:hypothetical protein